MFVLKCALILCVAAAGSAFEMGDQDVISHLFTRQNPIVSQPLLPTFGSILMSSFDPGRRTVFTIHSFGEGVGGNFNAFVVPVILSAEDVNVMAVDWSPGSAMYSQGLGNAPQCGAVIALFIDVLISGFSLNPNSITIVGHGLGGHIAGIAARTTIGTIPHIFALDPSFHGWTHHPAILRRDDALFVEVLHTNAGHNGYDHPLGHLDFYPNGGAAQNGCFADDSCSHIFAYVFYAESVAQTVNGGNRFIGTRCNSYEDARNMQCFGDRDAIFGGLDVKTSESGIYIFHTNFSPPFAMD